MGSDYFHLFVLFCSLLLDLLTGPGPIVSIKAHYVCWDLNSGLVVEQ